MRPLTSSRPKAKAAAISALKAAGLRAGIDIRRVTQLVWDPSTLKVSGLGHGAVIETGKRFRFWLDGRIEKTDVSGARP